MKGIFSLIRTLCRLLLGATFIFSGFVKSVDPYGTAYKLQDYFTAFGMEWLGSAALWLSILLSGAELLLGLLLLLDQLRPLAVWGTLGFMTLFTPLTLYLALANPVSDCGCFGDAIKLTNWQTFYKNLVLLAAVGPLLYGRWKREWTSTPLPRAWRIALLTACVLLAVGPGLIALRQLPILDFRPFHLGANLLEGTSIPPDAPQDEYATTFVYEKDGVEKEFTEDNYPWDDSTWTYVSSDTKLVKKGYTPPIQEFFLYDEQEEDQAQALLAHPGLTLMVISPFLTDVGGEEAKRLEEIHQILTHRGIPMILATSSPRDLQDGLHRQGLQVPIYLGDERVLKTVVRAHPGVILLLDGTVLAKWSMHNLPPTEYFEQDLISARIAALASSRERTWIGLFVLLVLGLGAMVLLTNLRRRAKHNLTGSSNTVKSVFLSITRCWFSSPKELE